jgi:2-keto-4-pentenoate hydratase/2-oxohepta-3-ene-1,7-dioic acid hydratase in catechol pathway
MCLPNGSGAPWVDSGVVALPVELGVVIGKTGRDISQANAFEYIAGYGNAVC